MLLQEYLYSSAEKFPEKECLIHGKNKLTYRELLNAAQSIATWIGSLELENNFRAAILSDDPFEYIASYFGILMAGGVVVGLNTQTSVKSLQYHLADCGASVLFLNSKYKRYFKQIDAEQCSLKGVAITTLATEKPEESVHWADLTVLLRGIECDGLPVMPFRMSCDLAQIIYTSGTTGKPKGVMLRHANLVANTESIIQYLSLSENDRVMAVLPFFYSYGNSVLLTHIAVGGTLIVNQSLMYPNVILEQMVQYNVTGFSGVPSTFALLLHRSSLARFRFPSLRYLTQAGAAMSPALVDRLEEHFPGVEIYIMYGQTEASARLAYLEPSEIHNRPGSIGKAIPGVHLFLLDQKGHPVPLGETGEIVARGENIMAGYWQKDAESLKVLRREGLWTGDLARQDQDGFFYIISRKSDIIKSGGHRIGPKEIEDTLAEHSAIHEVAVIGITDEILDERIRACIVLKEGHDCVEKELIQYCRRELPAYKVPHEVRFFSELPKTSTGKIKKTALKSL